METERHDDDHLRPRPTAPGDRNHPLWAQLEAQLAEAIETRRAIHNALFAATIDYRDALAGRPLDALRLAVTCGQMRRWELGWAEQDLLVWRLRGEVEAHWLQDAAA